VIEHLLAQEVLSLIDGVRLGDRPIRTTTRWDDAHRDGAGPPSPLVKPRIPAG